MVPDPNKTCLGMEYFCFEGDELTLEELTDVQRGLSQMVEAPVAIQATLVLGRRAELEAVGPPTPTTEP